MSNGEGFLLGLDVAVTFGAGDDFSFCGLRGVDHGVAHRTDDRDRSGRGGRLRHGSGDDEGTLALRAFAFLAGVKLGDAKALAALLAVELDLIVLFGDNAVHLNRLPANPS
jgi:hypothetical protein